MGIFDFLPQVKILVENGIESVAVEASTLGPVTTTVTLYDRRLSVTNGCEPTGCTASLTRVGFARTH